MAQTGTGKLDRHILVIASVVVVGAIRSILDTTIATSRWPGAGALGGGTVKPPSVVRRHVEVPLAHAFGNTFWWAVALTALTVGPAALLAWFTGILPASRTTPQPVKART